MTYLYSLIRLTPVLFSFPEPIHYILSLSLIPPLFQFFFPFSLTSLPPSQPLCLFFPPHFPSPILIFLWNYSWNSSLLFRYLTFWSPRRAIHLSFFLLFTSIILLLPSSFYLIHSQLSPYFQLSFPPFKDPTLEMAELSITMFCFHNVYIDCTLKLKNPPKFGATFVKVLLSYL